MSLAFVPRALRDDESHLEYAGKIVDSNTGRVIGSACGTKYTDQGLLARIADALPAGFEQSAVRITTTTEED